MLLSHHMKLVCYRCILLKEPPKLLTQIQLQKESFHSKSQMFPNTLRVKLKGTHHTNREIVVDDVIRHWVTFVCHIRWNNLQTPAIHLYQCALFNLFNDFCQISAFISCLIQHV